MPELFKYSYRVLKFDLTAGLVDFEIPIDARKVVYASPTDGPEVLVKLQSKSNDQIPVRPQGEIVAPFQRLYLSASAVAKTIFLLIGSPEDIQLTGRDVSISGSINARDPIAEAGAAGRLFVASYILSGTASVIGHIELRNPTGSGKTVIVLGLRYHNNSVSVATFLEAGRIVTPLSTLRGNPYNAGNTGGQSSAQLRTQASASVLLLDAIDSMYRRREYLGISSSGALQITYDNIPEGVGLGVIPGLVNQPFGVTFIFTEF